MRGVYSSLRVAWWELVGTGPVLYLLQSVLTTLSKLCTHKRHIMNSNQSLLLNYTLSLPVYYRQETLDTLISCMVVFHVLTLQIYEFEYYYKTETIHSLGSIETKLQRKFYLKLPLILPLWTEF